MFRGLAIHAANLGLQGGLSDQLYRDGKGMLFTD